MLLLLGRFALLDYLYLFGVLEEGGWQQLKPLFRLMALRIPLVFFASLWNLVLYAYRAGRYFGIALLCWALGTGVLALGSYFSSVYLPLF